MCQRLKEISCHYQLNAAMMGRAIRESEFAEKNVGFWFRQRVTLNSVNVSISSLRLIMGKSIGNVF